jgi:uncharacterized glyoxalase superfamily protein PhnB
MKKLAMALLLLAGTVSFGSGQTPASAGDGEGFTRLKFATVLVRDYDEGLRWYVDVLGFRKLQDQTFGAGHRWIVVAPKGQQEIGIVLALPAKLGSNDATIDHRDRIGKETNWVFQVTDVRKLYERLSQRGVKFVEPPKDQPWGTVQAIFEDLYGNIFVMESPRPGSKPAGAPAK